MSPIPQRTVDPAVIEHRLLELAYTTDARITASALAYFAPCSIEDAEKVLDHLTARERIRMEVEDDGQITYHVPDRQKLQPRVESPSPLGPPQPRALVRAVQSPLALRGHLGASPALAAVLSMFIPGAGQLYAGRFLSAVLWFFAVGAGYVLILPGLILHFFCIISAASSAHRLNTQLARLQLQAG